jgi:hypothetical protein
MPVYMPADPHPPILVNHNPIHNPPPKPGIPPPPAAVVEHFPSNRRFALTEFWEMFYILLILPDISVNESNILKSPHVIIPLVFDEKPKQINGRAR